MRKLSCLLLVVYLVTGVLVALAHNYFDNIDSQRQLISTLLAIMLWPLVLVGWKSSTWKRTRETFRCSCPGGLDVEWLRAPPLASARVGHQRGPGALSKGPFPRLQPNDSHGREWK